jgi:hypothetical protein
MSAARTVSMEWQRDREVTPGECAAASAPGGSRTAAASRDWSRREHRRACMQLVRHQRIQVSLSPPAAAAPGTADVILSRAQRAHSRLSWAERLARNARPPGASHVTIKQIAHPSTLCCRARGGDGLTPPRRPADSFFSDTFAAPSGTSSSAFLAPHPADSSISHRIIVQNWTTFAPQIGMSSSTISLRNSWARPSSWDPTRLVCSSCSVSFCKMWVRIRLERRGLSNPTPVICYTVRKALSSKSLSSFWSNNYVQFTSMKYISCTICQKPTR